VPARPGLLGLGSNVGGTAAGGGGRRKHLQAAVDALPAIGVDVLASSSVYDTDPVGELPDQRSFLNACLRVQTELEPLDLLDAVKDLERRLGREQAGVRHGPRAIDIDILALGDLQLRHQRMTLPHEQLLARRFVLIPALELDFDLQVPAHAPGLGSTRLADALAALPIDEGVRWAGPSLSLPARSLGRRSSLRA
jgi:2-amino-4-hydroxy-6-hydroxymethyldihydropteridine diphosphokinase